MTKLSNLLWLMLVISTSLVAQHDWHVVAHAGDDMNWAAPDFNDDDWQNVKIPGSLTNQGITDNHNMAWYRIHLSLPEKLKGQALALSIGQIYDAYDLYFNGVRIAAMSLIPQYSHEYVYTGQYQAIAIPNRLIKDDHNVIAIRVFSAQNNIGMIAGTLQIGHLQDMITITDEYNTPYLLVIILSFSIFLISGILMLGTGVLREQRLQHAYLAGFFISLALAYLCENLHLIEPQLKTPLMQRLAVVFQTLIPITLLLYIKKRNSYVISLPEQSCITAALLWLLTFLLWNMPVKWLDEFSTIGLIIFAITTSLIFINAIKAVKQHKPEAQTILLAITVAMLSITLYAFGISHLFWGVDTMSLGLLLMVFILLQSVALRSGRERQLIGQYAIDVVNLQEKQRSELASELHDNIGQRLAVMKMRLGMIEPKQKDIELTVNDLSDSIAELRNIVSGLRPVILAHLSLGQAIITIIKQYQRIGIIKHDIDQSSNDPSEMIKHHLFRVFQECLQNAIKHSNASIITVEYNLSETHYFLQVSDNGQGYETSVIKGLGLRSMQERVAQCQGRIITKTTLNKGTQVQVWVPKNDTNKKNMRN